MQWQCAIGVKIDILRPENRSGLVSWAPQLCTVFEFHRGQDPEGVKILSRILS